MPGGTKGRVRVIRQDKTGNKETDKAENRQRSLDKGHTFRTYASENKKREVHEASNKSCI